GRSRPTGSDRSDRRDLHWGSRCSTGISEPSGADGGAVCKGPVQHGWARPDVPDGGSGTVARGWDDRGSGTQRSPGEDPGIPDRGGGEGGAAGEARGGERGGGDRGGGCAGREAPGGVCDRQ